MSLYSLSLFPPHFKFGLTFHPCVFLRVKQMFAKHFVQFLNLASAQEKVARTMKQQLRGKANQ